MKAGVVFLWTNLSITSSFSNCSDSRILIAEDILETTSYIADLSIGEGTLQVLREHRTQQEIQKVKVSQPWQENDLIFPNVVGGPGDPSNLRKDFQKTLARAGLSLIRFHDFRHTAASLLLNNNVPVIVVSKMLGHSKPSITMDSYGHLYHESQGEAAEIMDKLVTPILIQLPQGVEKVTDQ
jgi:hypothetical protein